MTHRVSSVPECLKLKLIRNSSSERGSRIIEVLIDRSVSKKFSENQKIAKISVVVNKVFMMLMMMLRPLTVK